MDFQTTEAADDLGGLVRTITKTNASTASYGAS
jgi:hypothetical protein